MAPGWFDELDEFIPFFKSAWCKIASAARNLINSLHSSDDLCLLFCLYPSCMVVGTGTRDVIILWDHLLKEKTLPASRDSFVCVYTILKISQYSTRKFAFREFCYFFAKTKFSRFWNEEGMCFKMCKKHLYAEIILFSLHFYTAKINRLIKSICCVSVGHEQCNPLENFNFLKFWS